ncbi:MAG: D-tagatose-bisphosphate aldolase, class II, non-catalytic subunit [Rhodanobacter sp.]
MDQLFDLISRHHRGEPVGIYSACSAHPLVIEAAILQALADQTLLLVEATSNQVDQFGGYTGMTPPEFRDYVLSFAQRLGFPRDRIILGGDHLGPNRWQALDSEAAMAHAETLIESYVAAGFAKIHLDCSMACADDVAPVSDEVSSMRAARLADVAERTARQHFGHSSIAYVVGTEVPVPGGAHETIGVLTPTAPDAARTTMARHMEAFQARGLGDAWTRVIGLVVQPGVEFDHFQVIDYRPQDARELSDVVGDYERLVFEAHSTDYQTPKALARLVTDHFAILKVGPALTFALREALFALTWMEEILIDSGKRSNLRKVIDQAMLDKPDSWKNYYPGSPSEQEFARTYSFSDRIRYYWPDEQVQSAEKTLFANLAGIELPLPLISQFFPDQFRRIRAHELEPDPKALVIDRIRDVLRDYARACGNP